eukprot:Pgem_evm1s18257
MSFQKFFNEIIFPTSDLKNQFLENPLDFPVHEVFPMLKPYIQDKTFGYFKDKDFNYLYEIVKTFKDKQKSLINQIISVKTCSKFFSITETAKEKKISIFELVNFAKEGIAYHCSILNIPVGMGKSSSLLIFLSLIIWYLMETGSLNMFFTSDTIMNISLIFERMITVISNFPDFYSKSLVYIMNTPKCNSCVRNFSYGYIVKCIGSLCRCKGRLSHHIICENCSQGCINYELICEVQPFPKTLSETKLKKMKKEKNSFFTLLM